MRGRRVPTYILVDADTGKSIKIRVSFTDDGGNEESLTSTATDAVAAAEPTEPPTQPTGLSGEASHDAITLTWDDPDDDTITGYVILRRNRDIDAEGEFTELVADTETAATTYTDHSVEAETPYTYRIKAINGAGPSERSRWFHIDTPAAPSSETTPEPANTPATGTPTISGTALVGEMLTVDRSGIADEDGLDDATFTYQWIRSDGGTDTDISGETASTYILVLADLGKTVRVRVSFTDEADNQESVTSAATETVAAKPNSPAAGAPTITGTAQVGETLVADTSGISDADGLTSVSYSYQWLADDAEIAGATASTYTLADADEGKTVKVQVSFTDDADNDETLTSAATAVVKAPLTASLENTPDTHDGQNVFTFELRFSEEFSLSYRTLRDHAFTVAGGAVEKAERITKGSNLRWQIVVEPDSGADVTIVLPPTTDCGAQGAICTGDGKKLSGRVELTVNGPEQQSQERQNNSAAGEPTVSGTPQVDETLTADTSAISDEDGLNNVSYQYQWLRDDADIAGQTNSTYRLVSADEGKTIRVKVLHR